MESQPIPLTADEVLSRQDELRWELLEGRAYAMSSPSPLHQDVVMALALQLGPQLQGGSCRLYTAPLDVKLSEHDLVQPDLLVVCRSQQIRPGTIEGPPRLVIEVLSPSTLRHDRVRKLDLYGRTGVEECWLVNPSPFMVEVYSNQGGVFARRGAATETGSFSSPAFPQLRLDLAGLYASLPAHPLPPEEVRESTASYQA